MGVTQNYQRHPLCRYRGTSPRGGSEVVRRLNIKPHVRTGRVNGHGAFCYFLRVSLFSSITASTMTPMTRTVPAIPAAIMGSSRLGSIFFAMAR